MRNRSSVLGLTLTVVLVALAGCTLSRQTARSSRTTGPLTPVMQVTDETEAPTNRPVNRVVVAPVKPEIKLPARPPVRDELPARSTTQQTLGPDSYAELEARALALLNTEAAAEWALLRANALESLAADPAALSPLLPRAIADPNRGVRFVALMLVSRLGLCDLEEGFGERLLDIAYDDKSASVRAAALAAAFRCGRKVDLSELAVMVRSGDTEIRANAFLVLGQLGESTAVPMIRDALGQAYGLSDPLRARLVDLQGAEALVRLGDLSELEPIRAALFAPGEESETTALAIQILVRLQDEGARQMLMRLVEAEERDRRPPEIRLAAARAVASVSGEHQGGPSEQERSACLRLAQEYDRSSQPAIRAQAAALLGTVDAPESRQILGRLLVDPDPLVRISAAGSLLELGALNRPADAETATAVVPVH